jgi:drug/metabolite transporter (DMT)-like permease
MNPLNEYPTLRKAAYIFQWVANLILGVLGIVFLNDNTPGTPSWFVMAGLVGAFVWSYTGLTAQQNVPSYRDVVEGDAPPPE